jgi:hypothetical protein
MLAFGHQDWLVVNVSVRNLVQQVMDAVQSRLFLVDALYNPPPGLQNMGPLQHFLFGPGVVLPTLPRFQIHGAELPLLKRIADTHQKTKVLFFVCDREPILHEDDARAHQKRRWPLRGIGPIVGIAVDNLGLVGDLDAVFINPEELSAFTSWCVRGGVGQRDNKESGNSFASAPTKVDVTFGKELSIGSAGHTDSARRELIAASERRGVFVKERRLQCRTDDRRQCV